MKYFIICSNTIFITEAEKIAFEIFNQMKDSIRLIKAKHIDHLCTREAEIIATKE